MKNDGSEYEKWVNKFIKGRLVSDICDWCDIETNTTLYEVKGIRVFIINGRGTANLGRYQINLSHHKKLKEEGDKQGKLVKYLFVLKIDGRKMFKAFTWEAVNFAILKEGKKFKRDGGTEDIYQIGFTKIW